MKKIIIPTRDQVSPQAQETFDIITKKMGKVPNLYATIGYSATTLDAILSFDAAMSQSTFSAKEREAVNLVVSQINNCAYCLAAHTFIAGKLGVPTDEIINFRKGVASDPRLDTVLKLAKAVAQNKGEADEEIKTAFFNAGYNETALIELVGLVTVHIYQLYLCAYTD